MGNKNILIQGVLHAMVIVMQWIFLFQGGGFEYGLLIPILLHIIIFFGASSSINYNYAKSLSKLLSKLITDKDENGE